MDDRRVDFLLRLAAGALTLGGLVAVLIGYLGVRDHSDLVLQLPYAVSGGMGGLALIGLGAIALIQYQMRVQARRFQQLTTELDEWKDAALAEVRKFLESAEIEVEVTPATNGRRRSPRQTASAAQRRPRGS